MGIHSVTKTLASGQLRTYHYAWRGGPRIDAEPGSNLFLSEYARLTKQRADSPVANTFAALVARFLESQDYQGLRARTRRDYQDLLPSILDHFSDLPINALEERGMRRVLLEWHESMAATPRQADKRMAVVRRILSWAVDMEVITVNKATRFRRLAKGSRVDIIWSPEQLQAITALAPRAIVEAVMLALYTGQRQGDLLALKWSAYDGSTITLVQSKGMRKVRVVVAEPLKTMLDAMPRNSIFVLTNSKGHPWTSDGFQGYFRKVQKRIGISGVTFHDLRGTFVTVAYSLGFSFKQISEASGHSERGCEEIIRRNYLAADLTGSVEGYRIRA